MCTWGAVRRNWPSVSAICSLPSRELSDSPPKRLDSGSQRPQSRFASSMVPTPGETHGLRIHSGPIAGFASARKAIAWGCVSKAIRSRRSVRPSGSRLRSHPAVQLAGGHLIILGVACGTMGGYPHIAHVISADLHCLGQLKPGDLLGFQRVTLDEARLLDKEAWTRCQTRTKRFALIAGCLTFPHDVMPVISRVELAGIAELEESGDSRLRSYPGSLTAVNHGGDIRFIPRVSGSTGARQEIPFALE